MLSSWRSAWDDADLPFFIVQLPGFGALSASPVQTNSQSAVIRQAQLEVASNDSQVALITTVDIGDPNNLHPPDKWEVGRRLAVAARTALANAGADADADASDAPTFSGPIYDHMSLEAQGLRLSFRSLEGGLMVGSKKVHAEAQPAPAGTELESFALKGATGTWQKAKARIDGATVLLDATGLKAPFAVCGGWANSPVINLYNKALLPMSPFCTSPP